MKNRYVNWTVVAMLVFGGACGDDDTILVDAAIGDTSTDSGPDDTGPDDDAGPADTGPDDDAGPADTGPADAGPTDEDGDGYGADVDCDDTNPNVHPGATEVCDGMDTDCNSQVDDDASDALTFYPDLDGDAFGDPTGATMQACEAPDGFTLDNTDCDDSSVNVHPGAVELCGSAFNEDCNAATSCDGTCVDVTDFAMCDEDASLPTPVVWLEYTATAQFADSGSAAAHAAEVGTAGSVGSIPGVVGEAISMTGDGWVEGPNPLALPTANWTMATWVRLTATGTEFDAMMSNGNGATAFTGAMFLLEGEEIVEVTQSTTGAQTLVRSDQNVCLNEWTHVAMVYDAGTVILYVNGQEASRDVVTGTEVRWGSNPFSVGGDPNNSSRGITAGMDDSRFYQESLTAAQIQALVRYGLCNRPTT